MELNAANTCTCPLNARDTDFRFRCSLAEADDDVWIRAEALVPLLSKANSLLRPDRSVYMGRFESYHWATTPNNEGPIGFSYRWQACSRHRHEWRVRDPLHRDGLSGPFNFAKGALFFLSANLSRIVTDWEGSTGEAAELIGRNDQRCYLDSPAMLASRVSKNRSVVLGGPCAGTSIFVQPPVEDVWLGHALSQAAIGWTTFVDLDVYLFSMSPWNFYVRESQIVWHSNLNTEFPIRASIVQDWAANRSRQSQCSSWANLTLRCTRHSKTKSYPSSGRRISEQSTKEAFGERTCAGQPIRKCDLNAPRGCSSSKVSLWAERNRVGQLARQREQEEKQRTGLTGRDIRPSMKRSL
jgi:hypothetical protein